MDQKFKDILDNGKIDFELKYIQGVRQACVFAPFGHTWVLFGHTERFKIGSIIQMLWDGLLHLREYEIHIVLASETSKGCCNSTKSDL